MRLTITDEFHQESIRLLNYFIENTYDIYQDRIYDPVITIKADDAKTFLDRERGYKIKLLDKTIKYMEKQGYVVHFECNEEGMCLITWTTPEGVTTQKIYSI